MQFVPKTAGVKRSAQKHFRLGVPAANVGHHARASAGINDVCHDLAIVE